MFSVSKICSLHFNYNVKDLHVVQFFCTIKRLFQPVFEKKVQSMCLKKILVMYLKKLIYIKIRFRHIRKMYNI